MYVHVYICTYEAYVKSTPLNFAQLDIKLVVMYVHTHVHICTEIVCMVFQALDVV